MNNKKNLYIASDHAGFDLKEKLISLFREEITDCGTYDKEPCDYPIFAKKLINNLLSIPNSYGILICGSGIGMSIAANRNLKIRAALCFNEKMAELARKHNDSNIIVFGASIIDHKKAFACVSTFLKTTFEGGRHTRRLNFISE